MKRPASSAEQRHNNGTTTVLHQYPRGGVLRQSDPGSPESPDAAVHRTAKSILMSDPKSLTPNEAVEKPTAGYTSVPLG
jgi:hypothetical protein